MRLKDWSEWRFIEAMECLAKLCARGGALTRVTLGLGSLLAVAGPLRAELPDLATVAADLVVPAIADGAPAPGKRMVQVMPGYEETAVHHVLYLPTDWKKGTLLPVLVEFTGNGPFRNSYGDRCSGRVEDSKLGYGISGGAGFLWLSLPCLNAAGTANVTQWWGDAPDHDPQSTLAYLHAALPWVCRNHGGDPARVLYCGFSRGAIAGNVLGLHDERTARLWKGFVLYSHYDGVLEHWPFPGADRASARQRLARLGGRPQFLCGEGEDAVRTAGYLEDIQAKGRFTIRGTGFRNHDDAWILRPSPTRDALRSWVRAVVAE